MARTIRQSKLLEIIKNKEIETQEELVEELKGENFLVTQATISRDIKELGLTKVLSESGRYKYVQVESGNDKISSRIISMYRESVISVVSANNLIVIRTIVGSANSAALLVDKLAMPEILGCIAGDDTLLVIAKSESDVAKIKENLSKIGG